MRAVYTMPTLHNPLGWMMSAQWRRKLVSIARRHALLIMANGSVELEALRKALGKVGQVIGDYAY